MCVSQNNSGFIKGFISPTCRIPGRLNDRRTPLGELNWIFTAITDTIAWNVLPKGEAGAGEGHEESDQ